MRRGPTRLPISTIFKLTKAQKDISNIKQTMGSTEKKNACKMGP